MVSVLFSPITMRGLTLPNRVVVSPMCQYNSDDGSANDRHLMHLGNMSLGCAGLVMTEMTDVNPLAGSRRAVPACGRARMKRRSSACMISAALTASPNSACSLPMPDGKGRLRRREQATNRLSPMRKAGGRQKRHQPHRTTAAGRCRMP